MATLSINLVVDKEKNRVLFAEADKDFVDILCSFLTLPLGTVVRVLGNQSMLGCVDRLYESVQNLDTEYMQTEACKKMLLEPRSEAEILCEDLKLKVDDLEPRRIYRCPTFECYTKTHRLFSSVSGARCPCGKAMDTDFEWTRKQVSGGGNKDGVFVKGGKRYIITDDLHVRVDYSMESTLSIFRQHGIKDSKAVETKTVVICRDEVLNFLKRLLVSATPLTDILLRKLDPNEVCRGDQECQPIDITRIKFEENTTISDATTTPKTIELKLLFNKVSNKVLSAQAGEDLVDILFSFLTFPLGCIVKLLERNSSIKCLDNLYKSIECSSGEYDFIKSEANKNLFLAPKLYSHFGCSNQLLGVEEMASRPGRAHGCEDCWNKISTTPEKMCEKHNIAVVHVTQVNSKMPSSGTESGGGYAKKSVRFMITDEMAVTPFSSIYGIDAIKESNTSISSLVERDVTLGEIEVLQLLKACLASRGALNNVFSFTKRKKILND